MCDKNHCDFADAQKQHEPAAGARRSDIALILWHGKVGRELRTCSCNFAGAANPAFEPGGLELYELQVLLKADIQK